MTGNTSGQHKRVYDTGKLGLHPVKGRPHMVKLLGNLPESSGLKGERIVITIHDGRRVGGRLMSFRRMQFMSDIERTRRGDESRRMGRMIENVKAHSNDGDFEVVLPRTHPVVLYLRSVIGLNWIAYGPLQAHVYPRKRSVNFRVPTGMNAYGGNIALPYGEEEDDNPDPKQGPLFDLPPAHTGPDGTCVGQMKEDAGEEDRSFTVKKTGVHTLTIDAGKANQLRQKPPMATATTALQVATHVMREQGCSDAMALTHFLEVWQKHK